MPISFAPETVVLHEIVVVCNFSTLLNYRIQYA
uniref:Uncharacterized protein n=1 Tax=Arundo donax TaxID=35708 RepID=A0A0A9GKM5_ARUDO